MRRSNPRQIGSVCQLCASTPARTTKQPFLNGAALTASRRPANIPILPPSGARWAATAANAKSNETTDAAKTKASPPAQAPREATAPAEVAKIAEDTREKFLSIDGIPAEQLTTAALVSCLRAAKALHPVVKKAEAQSKASASRLAMLGAERTGSRLPMDAQLRDAINRISYSAYGIITHPNVEMKREFLGLYVRIQEALGRPESLPAVFDLYATKRKPVLKNGEIQYVAQSPNSPSKAVEPDVADVALQIAIDARNLDAALGIIESSFAVTAFRRQKLIKYGTAPAIGLSTLPFGIFGLATAAATYWQNTFDITTATGIGVAGISGYFLTVGSLGMIAKLSYKDQMKRVTWTPGTPLRQRWMREEERAALDRVACAWGFKETWRHGEETGPEWEGLKEYMGYRGMLLDRVEFMDGMA